MFPAPENHKHLRNLLANQIGHNARAVAARTLYEHGQVATNADHDTDKKRSAEIVWLADQLVESLGGADMYERTLRSLGL